MYDGKDGKSTVFQAKAEGEELVYTLDEEVDFETHFKCKRATKQFGQAVMDRLKIENGKLDVDWTGIKRITLERREKERKEAELAKRLEDEKKRKEQEKLEAAEKEKKAKAEAERKRVEEEKKAAAAEKKRLELEEKKRAEEEKKRLELEALEEKRKKDEFFSKIAGAAGGVMTPDMLRKMKGSAHEADDAQPDAETETRSAAFTKQWNDERKAYYWLDEANGDLEWRDPSTNSVWTKQFSDEKQAFEYRNKVDGKVLDEVW